MKHLIALLLSLILTLLPACSAPADRQPAPYEAALAGQLLECGAFSEELAPLDADTLWVLCGLESAGLSRDKLTDASFYRSTGGTCEEVAVLLFADEASAKTASGALELYLDRQAESNRDYRPAELPKLEKALVSLRGSTLLLLVANDYAAAEPLLK